jgi:RNA polymerase sigma-70 factor, ECF subfamily
MRPRKRVSVRQSEALTDDQLVARVLAGETALFEILVHRHSQRVYRAARAISRNDADAADVVQETFLRGYRHLKQFAGRAKFSTWLTRIAIHEAAGRARRRKARDERRDPATRERATVVPAGGPDPEQRVMAREFRVILEAAIDALPDLYRPVFVLRAVEEMSTAEAAECLNLTEDTVKTRLLRARALLREKLYASVGSRGPEAFQFAGERCKRMWERQILPALRTGQPDSSRKRRMKAR